MKKVNTRDVVEESWHSPKGRFAMVDKNLSVALGRDDKSTDLLMRHPFDVEICRVPPGKTACPFHSHSAQWEFYHVIAGKGVVRDGAGVTSVEEGDAFIFKPGEPHQIIKRWRSRPGVLHRCGQSHWGDLPLPGQQQMAGSVPQGAMIRSVPLDYLDGEE